MARYRKISIKKELADAVGVFIEKHPDLGFRSIAELLEDAAARRRSESPGVFRYPFGPRFDHFNVYEDHTSIIDNEAPKAKEWVDVWFRGDKPQCEYWGRIML